MLTWPYASTTSSWARIRLATTRSRNAGRRSIMAPPEYIADLAHPSGATPDRVGPKTATLARLRHAGLPVPEGVCLTAAVYRAQLVAAVRACWAALWATRALHYMETHGVDPAATAMAVLIQRLVSARAAGGALSRTAEGDVLVTGTWGLGSAVAQGEVVPDRFVVRRDGTLVEIAPGRKDRVVRASGDGPRPQAVARDLVDAPCLDADQAVALARLTMNEEDLLGSPVEVEWALGDEGLQILQARPLRVEPAPSPDELWLRHPALRGQPAGVGWGSGKACIVLTEHD